MPQHHRKPARNILPDLIIPALAFAFSVYYLTTITEVPWISQASAIFVSSLLFLAILAYAIRTAVRVRRGEEFIAVTGLITNIPTQVRRMVLLALTIGYVFVLDRLGFTLSTFLFLFLGIMVLSSVFNWKKALQISVACAVTGYVIFIFFFKTRFPQGWLETTIEELLRNGA